jgi:hypothetical protein
MKASLRSLLTVSVFVWASSAAWAQSFPATNLFVRAKDPNLGQLNGVVEILHMDDVIHRVDRLGLSDTKNIQAEYVKLIIGARSSGQRINVSKNGLSIEGPAPKISSDEASRLSTRIEALEKRIETLEKASGKCCKTDPGFAPETQADGAHK